MQEQEKQLQDMLNVRFGYGTWKEMIELRRSIRKEREKTIYNQMERRRAFFENVAVVALTILILTGFSGLIWVLGLWAGWW